MTVPLMILAVGAVGVGVVLGPTGIFEHFLEEHWVQANSESEPLKAGITPNTSTVRTSIWSWPAAVCSPWPASLWPG